MKRTMLLSTAVAALLTAGTAMAQTDSDRRRADDPSRPQMQTQDRQRGAAPQARPQERDRQQGAQAPQSAQPQSTTGQGADQGQQPQSSDQRRDRNRAQSGQSSSQPASQDTQRSPDRQRQQTQSGDRQGIQSTQSGSTPSGTTSRQSIQPNQQSTTAPQDNQSTQQSTTAPAQQPSAQSQSSQQTPQQGSAAGQAAAVQLNDQQRTRISAAISQQNARPLTNVNFSISTGTVVPRTVRVQTLPPAIVSIVPQYRGYSYVLVEDRIVIIEPKTRKIVTVIEHSGGRPARTASTKKLELTTEQRASIRRHATSQQRSTTGSGRTTRITVGERIPDRIELQSFPTVVYDEVPVVREYRYFVHDGDVVLVDPGQQRIVEIIR